MLRTLGYVEGAMSQVRVLRKYQSSAEDSEASPGSRQCGLDNRGFTSQEVTACSPECPSTGNTTSQGYTGNKVAMNSGSLAGKQIGPKTVRAEVTLR